MRGRVFALLNVLVVTAACNPCENHVVRRIPSPDRERQAVVFGRKCGATTGYNTQVSVIPPYTVSDDPGNVLIIDANREELAIDPAGGPAVEVRWTGPRNLELRYSGAARAYKVDSLVDGVRVTHVR